MRIEKECPWTEAKGLLRVVLVTSSDREEACDY